MANFAIISMIKDDKVIALRWFGKHLATNWRAWHLANSRNSLSEGRGP